jgi:hypothetical protein
MAMTPKNRALSNALLRQVVDNRDLRAVVEVRTMEGTPSILDIIRKEAFGSKKTETAIGDQRVGGDRTMGGHSA